MGKTQSTGNLTNALAQDSSNNIGIGGSANASYKLQVTGAINLTGALSGTTASFSGNNISLINASGSADFVLGRANTSSGAAINLNTNGVNKWFFGLRGLVDENFYIFNQTAATNNLILNASTGAATFSSSVGATNFSATQAPSNSVLSTIQLTTASGTLYSANMQLNTSGGLDTWTYNGTNGWVNRMTLTTGGNVGIGTSSPSYKLDVQNSSSFDTRLRATSLGGTVGILFETANDFSGTSQAYIKGIGAGNSGAADLIFGTGAGGGATTGTERMRITSGGNVGIGTSSPASLLEIAATSPTLRINSTTGGNDGILAWYVNTNYIGDVRANSGTGGMVFNMGPSAGWGGYIDWKTDTSLKMRLTNGGNLGIGSMTITDKLTVEGGVKSYGASSGLFMSNRDNFGQSFGFYSATNMYVYNTAIGVVGNFNMTTGVYTPVSDINKKKDFEASTIGLKEVLGLKPTLYRMKSDETEGDKELGFIAQEVKEFIPQAYVESGEDENKFIGLNFNAITAGNTKAIQELYELALKQQAQIEELSNKIVALESK
jgi:hypothetical protein